MNGAEKITGEQLLITPADIHLISGLDIEASKKEHAYIRHMLGHGSEDLMISQYCEYNDLDKQEIVSFLYPQRERFSTNN